MKEITASGGYDLMVSCSHWGMFDFPDDYNHSEIMSQIMKAKAAIRRIGQIALANG